MAKYLSNMIHELPPAHRRDRELFGITAIPSCPQCVELPDPQGDTVYKRLIAAKTQAMRSVLSLQTPATETIHTYVAEHVRQLIDSDTFSVDDVVRFAVQSQERDEWIFSIDFPYEITESHKSIAGAIDQTVTGTFRLNPIDTQAIVRSMKPRHVRGVIEGLALTPEIKPIDFFGQDLARKYREAVRFAAYNVPYARVIQRSLRNKYREVYQRLRRGFVMSEGLDIVYTDGQETSGAMQTWNDMPVGELDECTEQLLNEPVLQV